MKFTAVPFPTDEGSASYDAKAKKKKRTADQFFQELRRLYHNPRPLFGVEFVDHLFTRLYWSIRSVQFRILYKNEESDFDVEEIMKVEVTIRPPAIHEIMAATRHRFNPRWIKYIYAKFKNECPSGKMGLAEFKRLFGVYVPNRISDAYLDRMFRAFSYHSSDNESLTFLDLIECLSRLHDEDAQTKAEWTMRLMTRNDSDKINYAEFSEFVGSVFQLVGREQRLRQRTLSSLKKNGSSESLPDPVLASHIAYRAAAVFKELDRDGDGLLNEQDLVRFFQQYDQSHP